MNSRTYAQPKKAPSFSVLPVRKPALRRRSLLPNVGEEHTGFDFGIIPLFSGNENPLQTKLTIGKPGDMYEQEADSMADRIMSMPEPGERHLQRKCAECKEEEKLQRQPEEEDEEKLQAKELRRQPVEEEEKDEEEVRMKPEEDLEEEEEEEISPMSNEISREADEDEEEETVSLKSLSGSSPQITPEVQNNINSMKDGGQPLPLSTRAFFEPRFNRDFSNVRLHTDSRAAETAKSINARAFTVGRNIAFGKCQYSPETSSGRSLLAHELTHTVQQKQTIKRKTIRRVLSDAVYIMSLDVDSMSQAELIEYLNKITPGHPRYCDAQPNISDIEKRAKASPISMFGTLRPPLASTRITSGYGPRRTGFHYGIDYRANTGTDVYAATGGVVTYASGIPRNCPDCRGGLNIRVDHGNRGTIRLATRYLHLSRFNVGKGDCVQKGQIISKSGNTGHSTGPHLHFEIRKNGRAVNPANYL